MRRWIFPGILGLLLSVLLLFVILLLLTPRLASAQQSYPATAPVASDAQQKSAALQPSGSEQSPRNTTAYTLPPDLYKKAKDLSRIHFSLNLIGLAYDLVVLWLILHWKLAPKYRDWAEGYSSRRFVQAAIFSPLLIVTIAVFELPTSLYQHWLYRRYGISIEGWGGFGWDWVKAMFLFVVIGGILISILYGVIRRSPRRWWLYFWLISLPIIVSMAFVEPFVLEPMFFQFAPLSEKDPALVAQIEKVAQRAGVTIPPSRMFWMKASEKTPTMNAYVSGLGASKRVVVWDTNIAKETTSEIVSDVGHEMGHYVLGHVWKGLIFESGIMFVLLYLGFRCIGWMLGRWGAGWRIRGLRDWASLPALLLLLSIFSFLSDPISNAFSRHIEHQADIYGLEVTHGVIPNTGQAAADSFQVEGEASLDDPDPNPVNVFLFYDHPPIADRVRLCLTYDPWAKGETPQFVK